MLLQLLNHIRLSFHNALDGMRSVGLTGRHNLLYCMKAVLMFLDGWARLLSDEIFKWASRQADTADIFHC
jgi:hypothetical protein